MHQHADAERSWSPCRRSRASAGATLGAGDGRRARPPRCDGRRRLDRERAPAGRGRRRRPAPGRSRPTTACRSTGLGRLVDGGDGGDTYNYSPPRRGPGDRHARVGDGHRRSRPARSAPGSLITATYRWPRAAIGDKLSCSQPQRRDRRGHRSSPRSSSAPASASSGSAPSSTTGAATTGCGPTSRCRPRSTTRTPSARSPSCRRGLTTEGGPHETAAADVRVPPVRRRVRRRGRPRARARRPARVRARRRGPRARAHAAAGDRLPVTGRHLAAAEPGRPARPRSRARSCSATWSRRVRAAPPPRHVGGRGPARPRRRVPRAARAGARRRDARRDPCRHRAAARGSRAPSSPRSCASPAGSWCGSSTRRRETSVATIEHDGVPATGWVVDLLGRPREPFEGEVELARATASPPSASTDRDRSALASFGHRIRGLGDAKAVKGCAPRR